MPTKPKSIRRPWQPQRKAQERRLHNNTKFYTLKPWRTLRASYLSTHPFCECDDCQKREVPLPSQMVDHDKRINPHDPYDTQNGKWGEPLDEDNLRAMNHSCHNKKSGREAHQR